MLLRLKHWMVNRALVFLLESLPRYLATGRKLASEPSQEFRTFDDALETCQPGYNSSVIADVVVQKTRAYATLVASGDAVLDVYSLRPLAAVGFAGPKDVLRVVDFGGGAGVHYFTARALADRAQRFDWRVVETAAMSAGAQSLHNTELSFFSSLESCQQGWADPPDLVLSIGAIMCVPNPLQALESLLKLRSRRVYIGGTGLSPDKNTRIMVQFSRLSQNGPGGLPPGYEDAVTAYPNTFVPQAEFEAQVRAAGYRVVARKNDTRDAWRAGRVSINQYGYLLDRIP